MIYPETSIKEEILLNTSSSSASTTMKMNGKAFQVLSSGLYSNKVRAVIRELCTNAWDAHIDAGNKADFDVWLPTAFNPQFRIRDYGTGMSKNNMFCVFNCLFESTKTNTNEQSGMLGLGSKSPFAYTNMMQVASYQGGLVNYYNLVLDKQSLPILSHMGESSTQGPDGLEVMFSVSNGDFERFKQEAAIVSRAFVRGPKPNFHGLTAPVPLQEIVEGVFVAPTTVDGVGTFILQGNVAYPWRGNVFSDAKLSQLTPGRGAAVYFEFPIGSLDFVPSREALTRDADSDALVDARALQYREALLDYYLETYQDKLSLPELQAAYRTVDFPKILIAAVEEFVDFPVAAITGKSLELTISRELGDIINVQTRKLHNRVRVRSYSRDNTSTLTLEILSERIEDTLLVIVDERKCWRKRLESHSSYGPLKNLILVHQNQKQDLSGLDSLMRVLPVVRISETAPYKMSRTGGGGDRSKAYSWFGEIDVDLQTGQVERGFCGRTLQELGVKPGEEVVYLSTSWKERAYLLRKYEAIPPTTKLVFVEMSKGRVIPDCPDRLKRMGGVLVCGYSKLMDWIRTQDWENQVRQSKRVFKAMDTLDVLFGKMAREEAANYYFAEKYLDIRDSLCDTVYDELAGKSNDIPSRYSVSGIPIEDLKNSVSEHSKLIELAIRRGDVGKFRSDILKLLKKEKQHVSARGNSYNQISVSDLCDGRWFN